MANVKANGVAMNAGSGGGFIRWDWNKNKYVWVNAEDFKRQSSNKKLPAPSPYEHNVAALKNNQRKHNRPSFRVPVKKAYRQPLVMSNKQPLLAKGPKAPSPVKKAAKAAAAVPGIAREDLVRMRQRVDKENRPARQAEVGSDVQAPPAELMAGHSTFVSIVSNRLIHLNAALTFWRQNPGALISYLKRTADDSVTVDLLPLLTSSLVRQTPKSKLISMGAWLEFLPTLEKLLGSKFADYIKASLDLIRTLLRHWSKELEHQKVAHSGAGLLQSQSVTGIYSGMVAMSDTVTSLATRTGSVGKKAKVVRELLDKL